MAFKTFTAGSVLTAAEVNDYLMKQAVIVCTAATRPSSPVEGMVIYETDTDRFLAYSGTAWIRQGWAATAGRTGVRLRRAAVQSIPDAATTAVSWDTEDYDSDGFITVPATTITIPAGLGGIYTISASCDPVSAPTVRWFLDIQAGGRTWRASGAVTEDQLALSVTVDLAAAATVVINLFQDSAGAINYLAALEMFRWPGA